MKRKVYAIVYIIAICLSLVLIRNEDGTAGSANYELNIEGATVEVGREFFLNIDVSSVQLMEQVSAYINYDNEVVEFIGSEDGNVVGSAGVIYLNDKLSTPVYEKTYQIRMKALGEGKTDLKVEDANLQINQNTETVELSVNTSLINVTKTLRRESALVDNILVFPGELNEEFQWRLKEYSVNLDDTNKELILSVIPKSDDTVVEVEGNENFTKGQNLVKIYVTSITGETAEYTITVNIE